MNANEWYLNEWYWYALVFHQIKHMFKDWCCNDNNCFHLERQGLGDLGTKNKLVG